MTVPIFQVDAFTSEPFAGNPAGVCLLREPKSSKWMQHVAAEMNLSETAFLLKQDDGYSLRWFTPTVEVDLCGHATLASAHILRESGVLKPGEQVRFHTLSGVLKAMLDGGYVELSFPSEPPEVSAAPEGLLESLGIGSAEYVGRNRMDYIIEVESEDKVRKMKPDFAALRKIPTRGIIVTAVSSKREFDFVSRFFGPAVGVDEDPVTGSAHCCLGPYWSRKLGKNEFNAFQVSKRGGVIKVRVAGDRTYLKGEAVTVIKGELNI